jgi:hypothetical protein
MSKHWTTKLKEENAKLKSDMRKIVNGDFETTTIYKVKFTMEDSMEKIIWSGGPSVV